jgi:hypothetical protein
MRNVEAEASTTAGESAQHNHAVARTAGARLP